MTTDWKAVWERKGKAPSDDQYDISGFEEFRSLNTEDATNQLSRLLDLIPTDSVLEIGCAGGLLGRHLQKLCYYVGTDYSPSMVEKTIKVNNFSAVRCEANDLVFKDKMFDHVFAFSVFQYFPSYEYAHRAISEMQRVARKTVCVSDIPTDSHDATHLLYKEDFFPGWTITEGFYQREHRRFTATLRL